LNRQSAQVFLLRLFVELLEATDHCDPTKSDAIWKGSLEKALPRDQETLEEFARAVCVVLTDEVAELQAEWQVRLENVKDQDRVARYTDLLSRNLQAFEIAKSWVSLSIPLSSHGHSSIRYHSSSIPWYLAEPLQIAMALLLPLLPLPLVRRVQLL